MIKEKIKTLVIVAQGEPYPKRVFIDTFVRGLMKIPYESSLERFINKRFMEKSPIRRIFANHYEKLSYMQDWLDSIKRAEQFDVTICNINNLIEYRTYLKKLKDYDLILLMHSVIGDDCRLIQATAKYFLKRKGKIAVFVGDECNLVEGEKKYIDFNECRLHMYVFTS